MHTHTHTYIKYNLLCIFQSLKEVIFSYFPHSLLVPMKTWTWIVKFDFFFLFLNYIFSKMSIKPFSWNCLWIERYVGRSLSCTWSCHICNIGRTIHVNHIRDGQYLATLKHTNKSKLTISMSWSTFSSLISSTHCISIYVVEIAMVPIVPTRNISWLGDKFSIVILGKNDTLLKQDKCFLQF